MKLSVVMTSHNTGARINANILNVCAIGMSDVEVIIRDNSGNEEKRKFLSQIHEKGCRIISVDECSAIENAKKALDEATADFIYVVCDDDYLNTYALPTICRELDKIKNDPQVIGTTGFFVVDNDERTSISIFNGFDKPEAMERIHNFLGLGARSVFQYSPLRRSVLNDVWSFLSTMPVALSYHDQLMNCMFLMHGRLPYVERFFYHYYDSNWATGELCLKTDAHYFRKMGLDTSGVRLQWLINAFEGAQMFLSKYQRVSMSDEERKKLALYWFNHYFALFVHTIERQAEGAKFDGQALKLAEKWKTRRNANLPELATDISEYYALSSPEIAQKYYEFWK